MASTGNKLPTAASTVARSTFTAWGTPTNIEFDDGVYTSAAVPTQYLVASSFSMGLPSDCTINGVTMHIQGYETGSGTSNFVAQLHSNTTPTLIGSSKGPTTVSGGSAATPNNYTLGGTADVWGATLTPAIVNASGFGVSVWSDDTVNTLFFDYLDLAIEYTLVPWTFDSPTAESTITGHQPTVNISYNPTISTTSMAITGYGFTADQPASDTNIPIDVGSLTTTTYDVTVVETILNFLISSGSIETTPYSPSISFQDAVGDGLISTEGYAPTLIYSISSATGELIAASYIPTLGYSYDQAVGTVTFTSYDLTANVGANVEISIPVGSINIVVPYDYVFTPDTGTITYAGSDILVEIYKIIFIEGTGGASDYSDYLVSVRRPHSNKVRKKPYRLRAA